MRRLLIGLLFGWAAMFLGAGPAAAAWQRATSTHFILYVDGSQEQARAVAERLERFDGLLRRLSLVPPRESPIRLTIYMPASDAGVASLAGSDFVAGYYKPSVAGSFMVAPRRSWSRSMDFDTVLNDGNIPTISAPGHYSTAYPAWFVEGAELLSTAQFNDSAIMIGGSRTTALRQG